MRESRPNSKHIGTDRRGLSIQVGYVLAIGIITILMAGMVYSTGGLVSQTTEQGVEAELQIIGDRIAAQVMVADRILTADTGSPTLVLDANVPARANDERYTLNYSGSSLILESVGRDATVAIPLQPRHDVEVTSTRASEWRIYTDGDTLTIGDVEDVSR